MALTVATILSVGLAFMSPDDARGQRSRDLAGCLEEEAVKAHVKELAAADWRLLTRKWVGERWPRQLDFSAREPGTNEVLGFEQRGRVINHEVQCGITYLFAPNGAGNDVPQDTQSAVRKDRYHLRSITLRQADPSRHRAVALAEWVITATGAPPSAKGTWSIQFDSRDSRPVAFKAEYAWPAVHYRQILLVRVVQARDLFILEVVWNAEAS